MSVERVLQQCYRDSLNHHDTPSLPLLFKEPLYSTKVVLTYILL